MCLFVIVFKFHIQLKIIDSMVNFKTCVMWL